MPVFDEEVGRYRATVDDFLVTSFPSGRWPYSYTSQMYLQTPTYCYGSNNWHAIGPGGFDQQMDMGWFSSIWPGSAHVGTDFGGMAQWGGYVSGVGYVMLNVPGVGWCTAGSSDLARDAVLEVTNQIAPDIGALTWDGKPAGGSYSVTYGVSGFHRSQHHMDFRADGATGPTEWLTVVRSGQPYSYSGEYGNLPNMGGAKPKPGWPGLVGAWLTGKIATRGWRWWKPQTTWPKVRPLSNMVSWGSSGSNVGYPYSSSVDVGHPYQRTLRYLDSDRVPWVKFKDWTEYGVQYDGLTRKNQKPIVHAMYGHGYHLSYGPDDVVWGHPQAPAGQVWASAIRTLDGTIPATVAEASALCGVTVSSWYLGIPGLVQGQNVAWPGQFANVGKGVNIRGLHWPVGSTFIGLTTLDQLMGQAAVKQSLDMDLYPESTIGPTVTMKVGVELLTVDLSMQAGFRFGGMSTGAAQGGYDGGEIEVPA